MFINCSLPLTNRMDIRTLPSVLLVRDIMTVGVPTCSPVTNIIDIAQMMMQQNLEAVIVLDEQMHAIGVVVQSDLVKAYQTPDMDLLKAEDVMQEDICYIPADIPVNAAIEMMRDVDSRILFISHHAGGITYPAAYLTYVNVLKHMAKIDQDGLGINAERKLPLDAFIERRDAARRMNLNNSK